MKVAQVESFHLSADRRQDSFVGKIHIGTGISGVGQVSRPLIDAPFREFP